MESSRDFTIPSVMGARRLAKIRESLDSLPSMPLVLTQLLDLLNDDRSSVSELEEHFRRDAALAAKMLRLVNSPLFGLRQTVSSITQAAAMLGYNTMRSMVLGAWVANFLAGEIKPYGYAPGGLWLHSLAAGFVARDMARELRLGSDAAEELFLAGLLHDVGKLPLSQHADPAASLVPQSPNSPTDILELEREHLSTDHAQIGAEIAERWRFPDLFSSTILDHHAPPQGGDAAQHAALVHLADWCCNAHRVGIDGDRPSPPPIDPNALTRLSIDPNELGTWLERSEAVIDRVKNMEAQGE